MNLNNLTIKSQEAIHEAQTLAQQFKHQQIEQGHLLKGIIAVDNNVVPFLFNKLNVNINIILKVLDKEIESYPKVQGGDMMWSRSAGEVLNQAAQLAKKMKDDFVAIDHLILGLFKSNGSISKLFKDQGITEKALLEAINQLRQGENVTSKSQEMTYDALNKYAKNLNKMAFDNKLDPVIGRDEEIRRILQILSRRTKNNPILVGEPGTGKTAIAEGLAHRIVDGDIPENLKKQRDFCIRYGCTYCWCKIQR